MSPNLSGRPRQPKSKLMEEIKTGFGTYENFVDLFTSRAKTLFGSGKSYVAWQIIPSLKHIPLHIISVNIVQSPF